MRQDLSKLTLIEMFREMRLQTWVQVFLGKSRGKSGHRQISQKFVLISSVNSLEWSTLAKGKGNHWQQFTNNSIQTHFITLCLHISNFYGWNRKMLLKKLFVCLLYVCMSVHIKRLFHCWIVTKIPSTCKTNDYF